LRFLLVAVGALLAAAPAAASDGGPPAPGLLSLSPAVIAIGLALLTRQVVLSLVGGVFLGTAILHGGPLAALPRSIDLLITVTADADKLKVITFTLLMGGLVGLISASGGTKGVIAAVSKVATTPRRGALATWLMGLGIFFDDYASSLLVGNTMRPITDGLKVSREKLAYLVDSTAAPIASLAVVSTWIGYEVSVLGDSMKAAGLTGPGFDPYEVFLAGISSRFYPIFALLFVVMVGVTGRDFGPMLAAERRARTTGLVLREGGSPLMDAELLEDTRRLEGVVPRVWLALVPVLVLLGTVLGVLAAKGAGASYDALLYGAAASVAVASGAAALVRALSLAEATEALVRGFRAMTLAVVVLVLAWSLGRVMGDLKAGEVVASLIAGAIPMWSLPTLTFLLAGLMALATGTSWGTMAILFPILLPVVAEHQGAPGFYELLIGSTSAVLAGAVFGDHCSPISDTTVLSSIASASDHVDHTRTQAPYALLCAAAAIVFGTLPLGLGAPPWLLLPLGLLALYGALRALGRSWDEDEAAASEGS
jgi:Na+/H+ antiporter NhaC